MSPAGAIIMSVFAAIWWIVGIRASGHGSPLVYVVGAAVAGAIIVTAVRAQAHREPEDETEKRRRDRLVAIASAAEGIAIFLVVNVLVNVGLGAYVAPAIALIVGLHFLPLAWRLPARAYHATAALLIAVAAAGVLIHDQSERVLAVSAGAATILWLTSLMALLRPAALRQAGRTG
jgi:hypothetical protein